MGQLAVLLLVIIYFALASSRVVAELRRFYDNRTHGVLLVATLAVPYVLAALPAASADPGAFAGGLARVLAYLLVPALLLLLRPAGNRPLDAFDAAAILAVWLPIEFDWLPDLNAPVAPGVALPVPLLTAICLGFVLFLIIRPLDGLGYTYRLSAGNVRDALLALAAFTLVGLPLGIAMGFIRIGPTPFEPGAWFVRLLAIYFLNALPEELLFRGVMQNLIEQRFGRTWLTLAATAVIFGLSHLNNVTLHNGPPNWPYAVMATLAGLGYGWAWRRSGKITASAITHTLVNLTWDVLFRG